MADHTVDVSLHPQTGDAGDFFFAKIITGSDAIKKRFGLSDAETGDIYPPDGEGGSNRDNPAGNVYGEQGKLGKGKPRRGGQRAQAVSVDPAAATVTVRAGVVLWLLAKVRLDYAGLPCLHLR